MCLVVNRIAALIRIFSGNTQRYVVVLFCCEVLQKSIRGILRYILASFFIDHVDMSSW